MLQTTDAPSLEALLHEILHRFWYRGEWFLIPSPIVELLCSIQNKGLIGTPYCQLQTCNELRQVVEPLKSAVEVYQDNRHLNKKTLLKRSIDIPILQFSVVKFCRGSILSHYRSHMIYHNNHHKNVIYLIASIENPLLVWIDSSPVWSDARLDRMQTGNPEHLFYYGALCKNGVCFSQLKSKLSQFAVPNRQSWYSLDPGQLGEMLVYCTPLYHNRPRIRQ